MKRTKEWTEIEGIPRREWLRQIGKVLGEPQKFGLKRIDTPSCRGGYCKRHGRHVQVVFETSDGHKLCGDCARLWATRRHFKLKHRLKDL